MTLQTRITLLILSQVPGFSVLGHAEPQAIFSVRSEVLPSTTLAVADPAAITLFVTSNQDVAVSSFTVPALDNIRILKSGAEPFKKSGDQWTSQIRIEFLPLDEGTVEIPSLAIPYKGPSGTVGTFQAPPLRIAVVNAPAAEATPEALRDIKGPIKVALLWPWIALVCVLASAAGGLYYLRRRRLNAPQPVQPEARPRPLDELILEKLDAARAEYQSSGKLKEFYAAISDIFRDYLGKRFAFDSLEKTTSEIYAAMKSAGVERRLCLESKDLLSQCDLVKFAKFAPSANEADDDFAKIQDFVRKTRALG